MDAAGAKGELPHRRGELARRRELAGWRKAELPRRRGELAEEANTTLSPILDFSLASDNTAVDLIEII